MKIGVLGAGSFGAAIAGVLRDNGHTVKFFDPYKYPAISLEETSRWAKILVLAVPSTSVPALIKLMPKSAFQKPLLIATKGIMTLKYWEKFDYFELISGPGFADDIRKRKRTRLTVAARGAEKGTTLSEDLLETSYLKFDKTEDLLGVALLSGLKNIYAIESGRQNLAFGSRDFKDFVARAAKESERFLLLNGGFVETVRKNAGLGDLVLTCGGEKSRNFCFGTLLGGRRGNLERKRLVKNFLKETTVEGVAAVKELERRDLFIPRENEILKDAIKRIKSVTKH
ncbi:hypothetical protein IKE71_02005 [Candidatus Saccharibacteria bacterium]|nr:hypothetical protein [Candidatus Saccharibacteria bacterium]